MLTPCRPRIHLYIVLTDSCIAIPIPHSILFESLLRLDLFKRHYQPFVNPRILLDLLHAVPSLRVLIQDSIQEVLKFLGYNPFALEVQPIILQYILYLLLSVLDGFERADSVTSGLEGQLIEHQAVDSDADRPYVSGFAGEEPLLGVAALGRQELVSASGVGHDVVVPEDAGGAEVRQFCDPVLVHQDVLGLDVAVQHVLGVHVVHCLQDVPREILHFPLAVGLFALVLGLEALFLGVVVHDLAPLRVVYDQVKLVLLVVVDHLVQSDDVRVRELLQYVDLTHHIQVSIRCFVL